jgi:NADH-quinone oxidoreductase subunit M
VDIFFFYFFHELALIPTFIMVGIWGGRDRSYAAMKMTIYLTLGAMLSLVGLIIDLREERRQQPLTSSPCAMRWPPPLDGSLQNYIFGLLIFGFGILVSLWPLPHVGAARLRCRAQLRRHAACRRAQEIRSLRPHPDRAAAAAAGRDPVEHGARDPAAVAGNILVVGFITLAQRDLKQMIGYSSVMHMGYAFLGIACLSTLGAGGVVLMMVAHGLSVALLFLLATSVHHRTHTFDLNEMGGLAQKTPVLAAFFVAATMASIGLPGFANFWGELAIFVAAWKFSKVLTACAVAGIIISAIYGLRCRRAGLLRPRPPELERVTAAHPPADLRWSEKIPALLLLAALLFIGFWPKSLSTPLNAALHPVWPAPLPRPAAADDLRQISPVRRHES